jgi:hypothetical protein
MSIHCYHHEDEFAIWTNCHSESDHDGRCLGLGATFEEAKADALRECRSDLTELEQLTTESLEGYEGRADAHLTVREALRAQSRV